MAAIAQGRMVGLLATAKLDYAIMLGHIGQRPDAGAGMGAVAKRLVVAAATGVITSYSIHYTKLYDFAIEVKAGKIYRWCACGRSDNQPFCDGSHASYNFV